jgi:chorismate--pyruvate lyase
VKPSDSRLQHWLQAPGSLTARLRQFGPVEVRVQRQAATRLWQPEQDDLQQRCGYVREVVLLLNGRPVVWARSATPLAASKGPWRALQGLGTRPLAELLFAARPVQRAPLRTLHLPRGGAMQSHVRRQWLQLPQQTEQEGVPRWARSSVFWHQGHPLRVMEAFSPWVCALAAPGFSSGR